MDNYPYIVSDIPIYLEHWLVIIFFLIYLQFAIDILNSGSVCHALWRQVSIPVPTYPLREVIKHVHNLVTEMKPNISGIALFSTWKSPFQAFVELAPSPVSLS